MIQMIEIDSVRSKTGLRIGDGRITTVIGATRDHMVLSSEMNGHLLYRTTHARTGMQFNQATSLANAQTRDLKNMADRVQSSLYPRTKPGTPPPTEPHRIILGAKLTAELPHIPPTVPAAMLSLLRRPFVINDQPVSVQDCGLMDGRLSFERHIPEGPVVLRLGGSLTAPRHLLEATIWSLTAQDTLERRQPSLNAKQALRVIYGLHGEAVLREIELAAEQAGWYDKAGMHHEVVVHGTPQAIAEGYLEILRLGREPVGINLEALEHLVQDVLDANQPAARSA